MSTITEPATQLTSQQRLTQAANKAVRELELSDIKACSAALIEAAYELASKDMHFAERVRVLYKEITAPKPRTPKAKKNSHFVIPEDDLVPLKRVENTLSLGSALDPFYLYELYGAEQLPRALQRYTLKQLLEGVATVQSKYPGTKPTNKSKKDEVVAYIVANVAK